MPHRRGVNEARERVMASGAKGVKIALTGGVAGAGTDPAKHDLAAGVGGRSAEYPVRVG